MKYSVRLWGFCVILNMVVGTEKVLNGDVQILQYVFLQFLCCCMLIDMSVVVQRSASSAQLHLDGCLAVVKSRLWSRLEP